MNAIAVTMKDHQTMDGSLDSRVAPLGALPEPGHTPVPLKPTAMMLAAGSRAGGVSVETAWKIYLAMINEAA